MILCAEYGLHFRREVGHWRCVEYPALAMLRGERYRVGERTFGSLHEALRQSAPERRDWPTLAAAEDELCRRWARHAELEAAERVA